MATLPPALSDDLTEALSDDLVAEFFRRLPPEDPASLIRASLVCKRWRRIVADRGFCRRLLCDNPQHRRTTTMLGFFGCQGGYDRTTEATNPLLFTPTSSFRPRTTASSLTGGARARFAVDARHGRVLLARTGFLDEPSTCCFSVWDPITGNLLDLPRLPRRQTTADFTWKAVVLCASIPSTASCDHRDCHRGPFLVVFVGTSADGVYTYVYSSSQAGAWTHTASAAREAAAGRSTLLYQNELCRSAVAGNSVYFRLLNDIRLLKYDLSVQEISYVDLPAEPAVLALHRNLLRPQFLLTTTEYGGLGVARVDRPYIHLWSSGEAAGPDDGVFRWVLDDVIRLETVGNSYLPPFFVVDIVHSLSAIIIWAHDGVFSVDIESNRVTKLCDDDNSASYSVPFMSFCIPALSAAFTGEGSSAGASNCKNKKKRRKRKRKKRKLNS